MDELVRVTGNQKFMGKEIQVVLGGFGEDKKCISDKTVAEIHDQPVIEIRKSIGRNVKRFKENVDFLDLKIVSDEITNNLLNQLGYSQMQISKAEHIYILSERGYAKLIKIMDTDMAWDVHDQLMNEYFELREEKKNMDSLSPLLQFLVKTELEQKRQAKEIAEVREQSQKAVDRVESIREVVALNPNDWRKDTSALINKMAQQAGGYEHIRAIREESYKTLEERMGVALTIRLTNKKKTMSLNGVCKSKIDKLNQLDVIADDKKLIEGYVAVVKDMAIRYGVA